MTRRDAEANASSQVGDRRTPVGLKLGKNLPVDRVYTADSFTWCQNSGGSREPIPGDRAYLALERGYHEDGGILDMTASSIMGFWAVAALLVVAPGADWAFTLSATLRGNAIAPAVGGLVTGYAGMTAAVAAGIGALVAGSAAALTAITVIGGTYLVWLGIRTLRNPSSPVADVRTPNRTNRDTYLEGIGVSGLNPKGLLIFVALLPQFTNPQSRWPLAAQMIVLGLTFTLTCAGFYALLGSFARAALLTRPASARLVSRLSGGGMVTIGTLLVGDRLLN